MPDVIRSGLLAAALLVPNLLVPGVTEARPTPPGAPTHQEIAQHRAALIAQCPMPPQIDDAEAAKLPIHVTRWGTTGPRVLIIHGGVQGGAGGGPATFAKQEAWGEQGWRVEVVDRPGFGKSPTRGVDDMERDAIWISGMLGDGANLIGHSWGGMEALLAAARRPQAVLSLVLVEPALAGVLNAEPELRDNPAVREGGIQRLRILMAAKTPADYGRGFINMLGSAAEGNAAAARFEQNPGLAMRSGCALLQGRIASDTATRHAIETVARAHIPVLIVTGGYSPAFEASADVLARLTGGRHIVVRSPNHFVQMMNPADFNREVGAFMREADSRRASGAAPPLR
ncbi:alpha/beta fold hydrolase [Lichenicoccus sp.]|uniref:alpha/beta fold hydrolase n=1 Tax=Lichenicoccus sp. TaxID=2781899 RepID=UPI003D0DD90C